MPIIDTRRKSLVENSEKFRLVKRHSIQISLRKSTVVFDKNYRSVSVLGAESKVYSGKLFDSASSMFSASLIFLLARFFFVFEYSCSNKDFDFMIGKSRDNIEVF